jgi:uncharacterized phage infection (PIP) family protein YhgE
MRRTVFLIFGLLELAVAVVLIRLGSEIPRSAEVNHSFESASRVTDRAGTQVRLLHKQVQGLRRLELEQISTRLQKETRAVTATLQAQAVDFDTVCTMRDALGDVGNGLDSMAETLDPVAIGKLSNGLGEMASFLNEKVVPTAQQAADHLDEATEGLRADARRLSTMLRDAPPDIKAVREVYNGLARFRDGLGKTTSLLEPERLEAMREGFRGLESALTSGSEQVERLAGYTYPAVNFSGIKPQINQRAFWPEGNNIAEGMRKAASGAAAAGKEMDSIAADVPKIRSSLAESLKMVDRVRDALGLALRNQDKLEPLLKEIPSHASRLAEDLPKLGSDLAKVLRDTHRLTEVAGALRQAQKGIDTAVSRWPELRTTLSRLAVVLKAARNQLDQAMNHREAYESAMRQTVQLADSFASMLPLITDQLDGRLDDEEQTLTELGESLDEVSAALPTYARTASSLLHAGRLLAWLVAAIVGLHGCHLILSVRMGRRYSF